MRAKRSCYQISRDFFSGLGEGEGRQKASTLNIFGHVIDYFDEVKRGISAFWQMKHTEPKNDAIQATKLNYERDMIAFILNYCRNYHRMTPSGIRLCQVVDDREMAGRGKSNNLSVVTATVSMTDKEPRHFF
jgi:hypothetical protein